MVWSYTTSSWCANILNYQDQKKQSNPKANSKLCSLPPQNSHTSLRSPENQLGYDTDVRVLIWTVWISKKFLLKSLERKELIVMIRKEDTWNQWLSTHKQRGWKSEATDQVIYGKIWYCIKIPLYLKLAMLPVINDRIFGIAFHPLNAQNWYSRPLLRMELGVLKWNLHSLLEVGSHIMNI